MGKNCICIENVEKAFKNQVILEDVNLIFESGKVYGIIGKNGTGKSILLKMMAGLSTPTSGTISYNEIVLERGKYADDTGIVFDCIGFLPELSAKENLKMLAKIRNVTTDDEIDLILEKVGLDPKSSKEYRKFSLGMKQKLSIAQAMMENPKYLLLDEPLNALDEESVDNIRKYLLDYVHTRDAILVITSHNKEDIDYLCDDVYEIKNCRVTKISCSK